LEDQGVEGQECLHQVTRKTSCGKWGEAYPHRAEQIFWGKLERDHKGVDLLHARHRLFPLHVGDRRSARIEPFGQIFLSPAAQFSRFP